MCEMFRDALTMFSKMSLVVVFGLASILSPQSTAISAKDGLSFAGA